MGKIIQKIQLKRGTKSQWESQNPVLAKGEPGFSIDENKLKLGDGTKTWNQLPAISTDISGKEDIANKVSAWSEVPNDTHYPSEKLVYDHSKPKDFIVILTPVEESEEDEVVADKTPAEITEAHEQGRRVLLIDDCFTGQAIDLVYEPDEEGAVFELLNSYYKGSFLINPDKTVTYTLETSGIGELEIPLEIAGEGYTTSVSFSDAWSAVNLGKHVYMSLTFLTAKIIFDLSVQTKTFRTNQRSLTFYGWTDSHAGYGFRFYEDNTIEFEGFSYENEEKKVNTIEGPNVSTYPSTEAVCKYAENKANKTTSISSSSTDDEYPSSRAVYNAIQTDKATYLENGKALILQSSTAGSTKKFKITVNDSGTITATQVT